MLLANSYTRWSFLMAALFAPVVYGQANIDAGALLREAQQTQGVLPKFTAFASQKSVAAGLPALMAQALIHHPSLRVQANMQNAAKAGVDGAKWQYWPTPSVALERANTHDPAYRGDQSVATVRLQQPLWTGGRLNGNLSKAEAQAILVQVDSEGVRLQLAFRVIQNWSDCAAAQGKVLAYEKSLDVHTRLLALVERRTREGASAQADIDLARSRLEGIEADLASAKAQRDTALDRLRLLVGRDVLVSELSQVANSLPPEHEVAQASLLNAAREQSPLIAKARAQDKIAEAELEIAQAALSPEVYLRAERQYGNLYQANQDPQNRLFVGVSTAFGGGLSSLSGIDTARARLRAAQEDIQTQQLAVDEQVLSDITLERTAEKRRQNLERVRYFSNEVYSSWERQFLAGRKQWQDLMNAAREQTQNDVQLADAIAAQHLTGWRLNVMTRGLDASLQLNERLVAPVHASYSIYKARYAKP